MYHDLSQNVHVIPDKTDIGKAFEEYSTNPYQLAKVSSKYLQEYFQYLNLVLDIGSVLTLNLLSENLQYKSVRLKIEVEVSKDTFQQLLLNTTKERLTHLLIG